MAGVAWVARIAGEATVTASAWVAAIRGETGNQAAAWIGAIRGEAGGAGPVAFVAGIRGYREASAGAPTASAGAAVTVQPGSALRLAGSGVASSGASIVSYSWRLVSKSTSGGTITFSSSVASNPRIRMPLVRKASWYVLGLTATDSAGRVSPEATVRIDVRQAQMLAATGAGWRPVGVDEIVDPGVDVVLGATSGFGSGPYGFGPYGG